MGKRFVLLIFALLLPMALFSWFLSRDPSVVELPKQDSSMKHVLIGAVPVYVDVADTPATQVQGLSGRESLPENTGLLFVFDRDDLHGIWMKDMRFPIDILWADAEGVIVHIEEQVHPDTYPRVFAPNTLARYVIEVPSGFVELHDIERGQRIELD